MSVSQATSRLSGMIDGRPDICGRWAELESAAPARDPVYRDETDIDLDGVQAACALALHMHQPTIPAGGRDVRTAELIGHLQYMFEHPDEGDNHNAKVFAWCYERITEFILQLVKEGRSPRIMLDYSGNLLWGLEQMGRGDILDKLAVVTCDRRYRRHVEWLGTMWGHAVASSTPPADIALHVRAWQQHFASIFGREALARVRGFSPPEMHLPNDPDVAYAYIKTLLEAGYQWLMVQEHTVEHLDGTGIRRPHLPHRLIARNSDGQTVSIIALVKTQGSDNKLVAQMQPLAEARTLSRSAYGGLGGIEIPPLVTQIGDGENGGVMMNEFPPGYLDGVRSVGREGVVLLNGTEYLELIEAAGVKLDDYVEIQPVHQHALWSRLEGNERAAVDRAAEAASREVPNFHLDGGSWTNNISWVKGYEGVLDPMSRFSADFHEKLDGRDIDTNSPAYRDALLHLLCSQTSCFRYWGQGRWTDYAKEICRRGTHILQRDF